MTLQNTGRRTLALVGVMAATLALAACGEASSPGATASASATALPLQGEDAAAYRRWLDSGIDDYRFSVTAQCFCVDQDPLVVTVRDGQVVSVTPESAEYWREVAVAVPDLFGYIADARDRYASVDVVYDQQLGYPTHIAEDRIANAVDDEVTFVVSGFRRL